MHWARYTVCSDVVRSHPYRIARFRGQNDGHIKEMISARVLVVAILYSQTNIGGWRPGLFALTH